MELEYISLEKSLDSLNLDKNSSITYRGNVYDVLIADYDLISWKFKDEEQNPINRGEIIIPSDINHNFHKPMILCGIIILDLELHQNIDLNEAKYQGDFHALKYAYKYLNEHDLTELEDLLDQ
ncbi:MAG: hypothetical protein Q8Q35_01325 [Nanoarchaeota archaeon]|nr:hypothetical protein [Nanoarchaeota archaeon]